LILLGYPDRPRASAFMFNLIADSFGDEKIAEGARLRFVRQMTDLSHVVVERWAWISVRILRRYPASTSVVERGCG